MTDFEQYQKTTEYLKDKILEENRRLKRQLAEKDQSFELVKAVHYDSSINLSVLNDIIIGITGSLYSILFYKDREVTNLNFSNPIYEQVIAFKKTMPAIHQELYINDNLLEDYTLLMHPIMPPSIPDYNEYYVENVTLIFPKRFINEEVLEMLQYFIVVIDVLINIVLTREKMVELIETDSLTSLLNRASWSRVLHEIRFISNPRFILFIDADNFKYVNDNYGHEKGDDLLKYMARWLKKTFRKSDMIFRLGGDEFSVVGHINQSYREEFLKRLNSLNADYAAAVLQDLELDATISIGVLIMDEYPEGINVYALVDSLLYKSKNEGKNTINIIQI